MARLLSLTFLTALLSSAAVAATYYVDSAAGNDRNDGLSPAKAWRSLDKVANESRNRKVRKNGFLPGDQVLFKRGQLYQSAGYPIVKVAGTAASPVRLAAYGDGAAPQFDSTGTGIYEVNLKVEGTHASVEDLSFVKLNAANVTETGLHLSGTGLRATRCDVSGVGIGVRLEGQNLRVDHCTIHDLTMVIADSAADNDYGAMGVLLSGVTGATVDHNQFARLREPSPDYDVDGSAVELFTSVANVEVFANRAENVNAFTEMGGSAATQSINNIIYHHNLVLEADAIGYFHNQAGTTYGLQITNVFIEHNTFVKTNSTAFSWLLGFGQPAAPNSVWLRNNIIVHQHSSGLFYNAGQFPHSSNLYALTDTSWGDASFQPAATEIMGDPLFVDAAQANYRLTSASPAIDRGENLGYTLDADDLPSPSGPAPDLGAYEFRPQ